MADDRGEQRRGRGRPQVRSDADTLRLIFESARDQFLTNGYATTSMEVVASGAGISTKTLYRLIPNKAALFQDMVTDRIDRFFAKISSQATQHDDLALALTDILVECAAFSLDAEVIGLNRLVISEHDRFPEIAEAFYREGVQRVPVALAAWLRQQAKAGALRLENPDAAAGMLLGMMISDPQRAAILKQRAAIKGAAIRKRAAECVAIFLNGCLP